MLLIQRPRFLTTLLLAWITTKTLSEENQMTRHSGHHGHHKANFRWGEWTEWSSCSVECGRGIQNRTRDCRSMADGLVVDGCIGHSEEIKICENPTCLREAEDLAECKKLESRVFGGKRYRWKPYKHPRDECKLACRPIGAGFYLELGKSVSDGTACGKLGDRVCVYGKCKPVGCDGIIESGSTLDSCGVCDGDGSTCKSISKTFTDSVKFGYKTLGKIPKGATKILISEAAGQRNYLGVKAIDKSFSINTDFRLSRFGRIPGAGTIFRYSRQSGPECPDECIRADGPTTVDVDIVVLFYSDNKGISYSYNVPIDYVDDLENNDGAKAEVTIGGGTVPVSIGDEASRIRDDKKRPIFSSDFKFKKNGRHRKRRLHRKHNKNRENENANSDKEINVTGETGALSKPKTQTQIANTDGEGGINLEITYKNNSIIIEANEPGHDNKLHDKSNEVSNLAPNITVGNDKTDSFIEQNTKDESRVEVGKHNGIAEDDFGGGAYRNRVENASKGEKDKNGGGDEDEVENSTGENKVVTTTSTPLTSPSPANNEVNTDIYTNDNREPSPYSWSIAGYTECSETCGKGKQSPILECIVTDKRAKVDDSFCSDQARPPTSVLECSNGDCPPSWSPGPWSKCSVSCGLGTRSRIYICKRSDGSDVSEDECIGIRPNSDEQTCGVGSCKYGWYFTEWEKECPTQCGYGTLTRKVHCSSDSAHMDTACNERNKPEQTKSCRNDDCKGFWVTGPWSKCNASCGMAYQTRSVACAQKHRDRVTIVTDTACGDEEKPADFMSCDLEPCGATWFMTKWGECGVTCGTGQRSRDVRCLDDKFMPSSDCDKESKPTEREECSSNRPCPLSDESSIVSDPPKAKSDEPKTKPDQPKSKPEQPKLKPEQPKPKPEQPKTKPEQPKSKQEQSKAKPEQPKLKPDRPKKKPDKKVEKQDGCEDIFSQCKFVLTNRLCQYKYYQKNCCKTCKLSRKP